MNNLNNESTMNFWSFLDKNKYILIGLLLLIVLIIVFRGYSIDTPYFKIGKVPDTLFLEKQIPVLPETIFQEKIVTVEKSPVAPVTRAHRETRVKTGDTLIEVSNQPTNINTGTNNGIIGNDNQVNVNVKDVQRQLDEQSKSELLILINQKIKENKLDKNVCVLISYIEDNEAFNFARQIENFLKSKGYKIAGGGTFQRVPPIIGAHVGVEHQCISIEVGFKPKDE